MTKTKPKRGRPASSTKEQIALRVDADLLAAYRATGPGWHTRMHEALKQGIRKFGVMEGEGKWMVYEHGLRGGSTGGSMGSYNETKRWVTEFPSKDEAYAEADRLNQEDAA